MQLVQAEMASYSVVYFSSILPWPASFYPYQAWLSGQCVRLVIRQPQVRVLLRPLAEFVLARPYYKSLATLVKGQLAASCQLEF